MHPFISSKMASADTENPIDIIRLQLRKPKNWNWELSTSKSSPSICVPVIQLFNSKGRLLVEATDNGETKRRTWHSTDFQPSEILKNVLKNKLNNKNDNSKETPSKNYPTKGLRKSNSDTVNFARCLNNHKMVKCGTLLANKIIHEDKKSEVERSPKVRMIRSCSLESRTKHRSPSVEKREEAVNRKEVGKKIAGYCMRKSRSEVSHIRGIQSSSSSSSDDAANPTTTDPSSSYKNKRGQVRYRRSRSNDLFKRKLKHNDESLKRAEVDGYKNFINHVEENGEDRADNKISEEDEEKKLPSKYKNKIKCIAETISMHSDAQGAVITSLPHPRYTTRTSSAGTLIIREESLRELSRIRRRKNREEIKDDDTNRREIIPNHRTRKMRSSSCDTLAHYGSPSRKSIELQEKYHPLARHCSIKETLKTNHPYYNNTKHDMTSHHPLRFQFSEPYQVDLDYLKQHHNSHTSSGIERSNSDLQRSHNTKTRFSGLERTNSDVFKGSRSNNNSRSSDLEKANSFLLKYHAKYPVIDGTNYEHKRNQSNHGYSPPERTNSDRSYHKSRGIERTDSSLARQDQGCSRPRIGKANSDRLRRQNSSCERMKDRFNSRHHSSSRALGDEKADNRYIRDDDRCRVIARDPGRGISFDRDSLKRQDTQESGKFACKEVSFDCTDEDILQGNYTVQEPLTPSDKSRKNSEVFLEKLESMRRRCKEMKYTSSNEEENDINNNTRRKRSSSCSQDGSLIGRSSVTGRDVRVKMGANVSRHSNKGLSGRRSQSSGSICNGNGRHQGDGTGKCGSLPSYLDDTDAGCNNNHHECGKDDVHRIPALPDGCGGGAPLHWKFSDPAAPNTVQTALACQDQGYGSERSPEEEYPPPPPLPDHQRVRHPDASQLCHHHLEPHSCYPFITPESTFSLNLSKGSRGLGLSVTGGIDSGGSWPGLIRVKRLFPHQPASQCGLLNVGDLLLEANGIPLTGLTNYEALEVLRTSANQVELKICRPPPDVLSCVSPISEVPPPPPRREPPNTLILPADAYLTPEDEYYHGEFEVTLSKIHGSLGFTLRKEDDSALGHYVRALVREPALTDGRIKAGDKIIAVNDVEISPMTHEQAVQFLRQAGDIVKLRLYRDSAQTPVAALSPTETTPRASFSKKTHLRQEAVDMLNDIAVRKLIPNQDGFGRSLSPTSSPRRLRRHPCPSDASCLNDSPTTYLINEEQFHEGLLRNCHIPFDEETFNSLFIMDPDDPDKPSRPSSLDLYNPNQTPVATRKPRFNFSLAHNAYELNNLDPEVLDAPNLTYNLGNDDVRSTEVECGDSFPKEHASMPYIPTDNPGFSYKNPVYQSAHPQCGSDKVEDKQSTSKSGGDKVEKVESGTLKRSKKPAGEHRDGRRDNGLVDKEEKKAQKTDKIEYEVLAIELNRGWNSRLGFSLQGAAGVTYVSAVHPDSVAAKDGRIKPGDRLIKVNDESVENMSTNEIIDLLRIVRGPVCIVVSRLKSNNEDCMRSNAEN